MLGIRISYSPFSQNRNLQGGITIPVISANLRHSQEGAGVGFYTDRRRPAKASPIQRFNRSTITQPIPP